jgi:hypothetical protein
MTENLQIQVKYRHVPVEIISDLNCLEKNIEVNLVHDELEHFNAAGGPADIIVYINNHLTELMVGGLIFPAVYDGVKFCVKSAWKKLVAYYSSRKSQYHDDGNSITLSFEIKPDKTIEYHLEGNIKDESIDKLTEEIFRHLKNTSLIDSSFNNPDFKNETEEKPKIRMRFNKETEKWEPVNYTLLRKEFDDFLKQAEDNYNG